MMPRLHVPVRNGPVDHYGRCTAKLDGRHLSLTRTLENPGAGRSVSSARAVTRGTRYKPTPDGQQLREAESVLALLSCLRLCSEMSDAFVSRSRLRFRTVQQRLRELTSWDSHESKKLC
jgi:hypothetical protein